MRHFLLIALFLGGTVCCHHASYHGGEEHEVVLGLNIVAAASIASVAQTASATESSIKPLGWLQDQLRLMASGLAGHEYDFYNYVSHSTWLGGSSEYSPLNEAFPYWHNGLVPLAYSLDDPNLKYQIHAATSYVLAHQADDGWIGPETGSARNFWARYPMLMGLTSLAEANKTWETPVVDALHRFVELTHTMLLNNYTGYIYHEGGPAPFDFTWGRVREADFIISLQWLYEHHPQNNSRILMDCMRLLYNASMKWEDFYNEAVYPKEDLWTIEPEQDVANPNFPYEHGVNAAQGLKACAVIYRFNHNTSLLTTAKNAVDWTFTYHGAPSGAIIADERLAGLNAYYGAELCTIVETMYSLSYLYHALGTNSYADRAELNAFNALPAMLTPDWWAHQYVQQSNQPWSKSLQEQPFYNVNDLGQTFGLEPDYPCCTVNHIQGYPKYLAAMFAAVGISGLGHTLLGPARVTTTVGCANVTISCETNYPFGGLLSYTISTTAPFDFYVRVPKWYKASDSSIHLNDTTKKALDPDGTTGMHKVTIPAGNSTVAYHVGSATTIEARANDTIAITRGALLYALEIGSVNSSSTPANYPDGKAPAKSRDWTITNTSAWNVAIDPSTLKFHTASEVETMVLPNPIFAPGAPPIYMTVQACEIAWPLFKGSVVGNPPPVSERRCLGDQFVAKLVPHGSAKLHMAELPTISLS